MAKKVEFVFGEEFQRSMLSLMLNDLLFATRTVKLVSEDKLYSEAHRYLFQEIKKKATVGELLSLVEFEYSLKKVERAKRRVYGKFGEEIFANRAISPDFVKARLTEYARKNFFIDMFTTAQTFWNSNDHSKAFEYTLHGINELYGISFDDQASIMIETFEDHRAIYLAEVLGSARRIPTNIPPLDDVLRGGLEKGELGILLAEPKKGKSIGLAHMGCMAVMMRSARVAHFVLEGTTDQAILRYESRLTGIQYHRLEKDEIDAAEMKRLDMLKRAWKGRLELVPFNQHWGYTVLDIENKLKEMINAGRKPDLLVVDYADLLKSHVPGLEKRHEQTEVYRDLKRLAVMYKVAIWTASQARRPEDDPEKSYLLRSKDISESFEKIRIADIVCTLNQTPREKEDGLLRLHIDIYRSADTDITIKMLTDFERMIFYSKRYGHYKSETDKASWMEKVK